jgi:hypothetical protein
MTQLADSESWEAFVKTTTVRPPSRMVWKISPTRQASFWQAFIEHGATPSQLTTTGPERTSAWRGCQQGQPLNTGDFLGLAQEMVPKLSPVFYAVPSIPKVRHLLWTCPSPRDQGRTRMASFAQVVDRHLSPRQRSHTGVATPGKRRILVSPQSTGPFHISSLRKTVHHPIFIE